MADFVPSCSGSLLSWIMTLSPQRADYELITPTLFEGADGLEIIGLRPLWTRMAPLQHETLTLTLSLQLAVDEVGKAVQTHAIGHGLWVLVCSPDERWGKADGEAMHVRLMRIGLQPSLGRDRELHHIRGAPRVTGIDDFLLCSTRFGKAAARSTDELIRLVAKPGGGERQG